MAKKGTYSSELYKPVVYASVKQIKASKREVSDSTPGSSCLFSYVY